MAKMTKIKFTADIEANKIEASESLTANNIYTKDETYSSTEIDNKLNDYVPKEGNKVLSTYDFNSEYRDKLNAIPDSLTVTPGFKITVGAEYLQNGSIDDAIAVDFIVTAISTSGNEDCLRIPSSLNIEHPGNVSTNATDPEDGELIDKFFTLKGIQSFINTAIPRKGDFVIDTSDNMAQEIVFHGYGIFRRLNNIGDGASPLYTEKSHTKLTELRYSIVEIDASNKAALTCWNGGTQMFGWSGHGEFSGYSGADSNGLFDWNYHEVQIVPLNSVEVY